MVPGKSPAQPPAHRRGSLITSYHQRQYGEDPTAPSRANVGGPFTHDRREWAHGAGSSPQRHLWPQAETFLPHLRPRPTSLCGPNNEDLVSGREEGKAGGKLLLQGQRLWTFCKARDTLLELKMVCDNRKGGIRERTGVPALTGADVASD